MTIYVITYDLNKEESSADYKPLIDRLEQLNCHRYQASSWLGDLNNTAKEVHDHLKTYLDDDDALWVSEVTKNYAHSKSKAGTTPWLKAHPPQ
jgi:CRISPR-associated endonuclease Cas2